MCSIIPSYIAASVDILWGFYTWLVQDVHVAKQMQHSLEAHLGMYTAQIPGVSNMG